MQNNTEKHCSLCNDGERQFDNCQVMHKDFLCKDKGMDGSVLIGKPKFCPNCGIKFENNEPPKINKNDLIEELEQMIKEDKNIYDLDIKDAKIGRTSRIISLVKEMD